MCDAPCGAPAAPPPPALDRGPAKPLPLPPPAPSPLSLVQERSPQESAPPPLPHSNGTGDSPEPPADDAPPSAAPPPQELDCVVSRRANDAIAETPTLDGAVADAERRAHEPADANAAPTTAAAPPQEANGPSSEPPESETETTPQESDAKPEPVVEPPPTNGGDAPPVPDASTDGPKPERESPKREPRPETQPEPPRAQVASSAQKKTEIKPKSTLKLATVAPTMPRKRKKDPKPTSPGPSPPKRAALSSENGETAPVDAATTVIEVDSTPSRLSKRNRTQVQPYQSPTPELAIATKLSANHGRSTPTKPNDDKLIVFYKNEFLAVRNSEGGFYVCQSMQNVYRATKKIKIRWLSQDKTTDPTGEIYKPDFYDQTDIECVLTTLSLQRAGNAGLRLGATELARTQSILNRALAAERGEPVPETNVTEEHPDGLDLSLYKDESQLEKKIQKRSNRSRKKTHSKSSSISSFNSSSENGTVDIKSSPKKRASYTPKKSKTKTPSKLKSSSKLSKKISAKDKQNNASLPPISASTTNKTATTPGKTASKATKSTKFSKNKASKSIKSAPKNSTLSSTPSTSTGKTARSPRKPPLKK